MTRFLLRGPAALLLVTASLACSPPTPVGGCRSSAECPIGQTCLEARCVGAVGGGSAGGGSAGGTAGGGPGAGGTAGGLVQAPGESCEAPRPLEANGTTRGTTVGARDDVAIDCTGLPARGPDVVYALMVPPGQRLAATLTPLPDDGGLRYDSALLLIAGPAANCAPDAGSAGACLSGADVDGRPERVAWTNAGSTPRDVFLVVDSFYDAPVPNTGVRHHGPFELAVSLAAPPAGDRCETAPTVTPGTLAGQTLVGFTRDVSAGPGCRRSDGPERAYKLVVPAGQRLTAIATPSNDGGTFDLTMNLVAGPCDGPMLACLAGVNAQPQGQAEQLDWVNRDAAARDVLVLVGALAPDEQDTAFTLVTSLSASPLGDDCAGAEPLVPGQALVGQTLSGFANDYALGPSCASPNTGPDRVYEVLVPAGKVLSVSVTPSVQLNTSVSLVAGANECTAGVARCLVASDTTAAGVPDVARWTNRAPVPTRVLVLVDSVAGSAGTFDLTTSLSDPPSGEACFNATPLVAGAPVTGTTVGYGNDYTSGATTSCARAGTLNADRVYGFTVAPGQRARVTVTPDAGFAPSVSVVAGPATACEAEPRACVASTTSSSSARTVSFVNGAPAPTEAFAIIDSSSSLGGTFGIALATNTPPADDVCATAMTMLPPTGLAGQSLRGGGGATFERDYDCVGPSGGADRVYVAQTPPGQRFSVTVTPTVDGGFDPVLSVIQGPASACDGAARRCLAAIDQAPRGRPETATVTNATSQPQPIFVVVGSYFAGDVDTDFALTTSTSPLATGDVCENAEPASSGTSLTNQTLAGYLREYTFPGATCRASTGADRVYVISVAPNQTLTARVVPDPSSDVVLNLVDGPASRCSTTTDCLASADRGSTGVDDTVTWRNSGTSTRSVFLVVSRYTPGSMTFALDVTLQ
ncbi:MAG: hypothetical protein MUC96_00565 [Myxococcaceae bacterium]|nr:hypothetical protein [Myxococcaceae bacterium]